MAEGYRKFSTLLYGKIETEEDALKVIRFFSNAFYMLAGFRMIIGFLIFEAKFIADIMIDAGIAFFLRKFSRVVSVILIVLSCIVLTIIIIDKFIKPEFHKNDVIVVIYFSIILFVGIRTAKAAFKLHEL